MKKLLIPFIFILFSSIAYACISPDKIQFYYPININELKESLDNYDINYEIVNDSIIVNYNRYAIIGNKNAVT
ncbi:MAG: hypothetical protein J7J93_03015, partial [Candidatus Aenigmarchaeota archaeon]|nr:hypothetical protein [Candidatus Aenigmarchaeota archaeon]